MTNINPRPVFIPTPGTPTAAQPPTHTVGGFGVWLNHRTLAQVRAEEERVALQLQRRAQDKAARAERRERLGKLCGTCRGKSIAWKVGHCPGCDNSGQRR